MEKNIVGGLLNEIMTAAQKNNPEVLEDYIGENGLLYCGKCNTPKQCRFKALGTERTAFCMCECQKLEHEREMQKSEEAKKAFRKQQIRETAFPDRKIRSFNFSGDENKETEASRFMRNYAASFEPKSSDGLLLFGDCGTGKSFYAACIVNAVIDRGYTAKFTNLSEIESYLWGAKNKAEVYDYFNAFHLLVIDDFSAERDTQYMQEIAFNVIDRRCRGDKPMLITTNLTPSDIKASQEQWQKRIYSRVLGSCIPYAVIGNDRRKEKGKCLYSQKINKILNYTEGNNDDC